MNGTTTTTEPVATREDAALPIEQLADLIQYGLTLRAPDHWMAARIQYGACTKCGQFIQFEANTHFPTQEAADLHATWCCTCDFAKRLQGKDRAFKHVLDLFGPNCDFNGLEPVHHRVIDLLHMAVDEASKALIDKVAIAVQGEDGKIKATIKVDAKGNVIIDRTDTKSAQRSV